MLYPSVKGRKSSMFGSCSRPARERAMSFSGKMTSEAPIFSRMRPCASLIALVMTRVTPISFITRVARIESLRTEPMHTTVASISFSPRDSMAFRSVASATTA